MIQHLTPQYEAAINGIPDCFDSLTGETIRTLSQEAASHKRGTYPAKEAESFMRAHFDMLGTWLGALDQLDSEIRGDVVEGGISLDDHSYLKQEALALFAAQQTMLRAVAEYHCDTAGPLLDPAYGYAYELSNSTIKPL